ncbi:hypothetical protein PAP_00710 [Palaeococcus pacificus DY20341]|uniref:Uncharacterized protein n=1 Tax=Palaeococcus pacificus DY20341 TaxID=1343739 RepID=A0A075LPK2_9EURY|nr:hypothetical protein [Palaeococcus pacificus]AIF68585.1 hypothetical protein PAP_00710 [Palaeococcus pacificus DY20341]
MKRRGFVFTLDALLSLLLVTIFVTSIIVMESNTQVYSTYMRGQNKYKAEDTLTTLRTVALKELVPQNIIEQWKSDGTLNLNLVDENMPPLEIAATYWATEPLYPSENLKHKAEIILGYILNRTLKDYNYEFLINNYTSPYLRKLGANYSKAQDVSPATLVLSGYAFNQTPRGYMARAYLTKAEVTREDLYGWMRVLAGAFSSDGYSNTLILTRNITLPNDASIIEANGNFIKRLSETQDVYINGNYVSLQNSLPNAPDISGYLQPGTNTFRIVYHDAYYSYRYVQDGIGAGSGTTVYIKYRSSSLSTKNPGVIKIYNINSQYTGFFYLLENFVPGNITSINMRFKVKNVKYVRLYYGLGGDLTLLLTKNASESGVTTVEFTDNEIKTALQNIGVSYDNLSKMVFDFVVAFDAVFVDTGDAGYFTYGGAGYGYGCSVSECGGVANRILYGYPDSEVRINYISKTLITQYSIPLSIYIDYQDPKISYSGDYTYACGVDTYSQMSVNYDLPPESDPWYADYWVGYCFSSSTTQRLNENLNNGGGQFYAGPNGLYAIRVSYSKLYNWMMVPGQANTFLAQLDTSVGNGGTSYRYQQTRGIIKYFIQGYAGYGDVFPRLLQDYPTYKGYNLTYYYNDGSTTYTRSILVGDAPYKAISIDNLDPTTYAVDDAILRLFDKLNYENDANPEEWEDSPYDGAQTNPIDVDLPAGVQIVFANMGNIPGLFEPITITLRVWRED